MESSNFSLLRSPETVVIAAGHGGGDPGVVFGRHREADETRKLTDLIAALLKKKDIDVHVVPHALGLRDSIRHVNENFAFGEAWAIEIHRNAADSIVTGSERAKKDLGVYYGNSQESKMIGQFMQQSFLHEGAHSLTWARAHTDSPHGRLGWIADTNPVAHLLELGFINGAHDDDYFKWLAGLSAKGIFEAFTGRTYGATDEIAATDLLEELVRTYRATDLKAVFDRLGVRDVPVAHFPHLKAVTLAQWILESGWAKSGLATGYMNFGGLKWRDEMEGFAVKQPYEAHDGLDDYCRFESVEAFITGYWKFLTRGVYDGWTDQTFSPQAFIRFLLRSGYTTGDDYDDKVLTLLPEAEKKLRG
jgi:hypothetical protein